VTVFAVRQASHLLVLISRFPQPADLAGAEAYRYPENRRFIFAHSAPFCGNSFF
jgi:hypothetical protein